MWERVGPSGSQGHMLALALSLLLNGILGPGLHHVGSYVSFSNNL